MATIAGKHITTFDGKVVQFLGTCSYVLSRDVLDSTFFLIQNYQTNSITLATDNTEVAISFDDGRVRINDDVTELPRAFGHTEVTRQRDSIRVRSRRGFSLECDLHSEVCSLRTSGWYHGKLAGLMGTHTNEQVDDFTMSDGRIADDVTELAQSWQTGA